MNAAERSTATAAARRDGHTYKSIAAEIGTKEQTLRILVERNSTRSKWIEPLEKWLAYKGYAGGTAPVTAKDLWMAIELAAKNPAVTDEQQAVLEDLSARMVRYMRIQEQQQAEFCSMYNVVEELMESLRKE